MKMLLKSIHVIEHCRKSPNPISKGTLGGVYLTEGTWHLCPWWPAWAHSFQFLQRHRRWSCVGDRLFPVLSASDRTHQEFGQSEFQIVPVSLLTMFWAAPVRKRRIPAGTCTSRWRANSMKFESSDQDGSKFFALHFTN